MSKAQVEARVRARPIRVAYLVPEAESSHEILDAVFAASSGLWGGRYHLIVPCVNGKPRADYLSWAETYDPDIVYSYADIDQVVTDAIHERFGPSFLVKHEVRAGDNHPSRFDPKFPVELLTCLAVAPQYARAYPASAPRPMSVVDYAYPEPADRFIDDNFGSPRESFAYWPLPESLADVVKPLYFAKQQTLEKMRPAERPSEALNNVPALLRAMAKNSNSFGLANLAADSAPRIELREQFRQAFTLIIGETFADRVLHWNERGRVPAYMRRDFTGLIVSPSRMVDEPEVLPALVEFINRRNHINPSTGSPWVELRSASLTSTELDGWRARFAAEKSWNTFHLSKDGVGYVPPSPQALRDSGRLVSGHSSFDWSDPSETFPVDGMTLRLGECRPEPLVGVVNPSRATVGLWALDVYIERKNTVTPYMNVTHTWRLPRRLRMHPAFCEPYLPAERPCPSWFPRSGRNGALVLATAFAQALPAIAIPDDERAFRVALTQTKRWRADLQRGDPIEGPLSWIRPSDKGRFLTATLRLFGGLFEARQYLLNAFWRPVFATLGAEIGEDRHGQIVARLQKRIARVDPASPTGLERLAEIVAQEAFQVRVPAVSISYTDLKRRHEPFLKAEAEKLKQHQAEELDEWMERAKESLAASVKALCGRGVLFQGYEWQCVICYNRNWNELRTLDRQVTCSVCGSSRAAPVDEPWNFRLDGFVRDAVREHGVLALVWALTRLASGRHDDEFYFIGPHELFLRYRDQKATPDHELDALAVVGAHVHLLEVKTSSRGIDLDSLVEVAKLIRPDFVTLAVMEERSGRLEATFADLQTRLKDTGIVARLLTLERDDSEMAAYLPD